MRSRTVLGGAFLIAVAGLVVGVGDPSSSSTPRSGDGLDAQSTEWDSYPDPTADCGGGALEEAVAFAGPAGAGLCIATQRSTATSKLVVGAVRQDDPELVAGFNYTGCSAHDALGSLSTITYSAEAGEVLFGATSPRAAVIELDARGGGTRRASTIELESAPGVSYFVVRVDDVDSITEITEIDDRGDVVDKSTEVTPCDG